MSVYLKKKDYVRVILEGEVQEVYDTGNFFIGNNLIERDLPTFVSVLPVDRPPAVGQIVNGSEVANLVKPGTVIQAVSSGTLWFLDNAKNWSSSTGSVVQAEHFYRAHTFRVVFLP